MAILDDVRQLRGMSASELARRCEISQSQMSKYLRAERTLNLEQIDTICEVLGVPIVRLISEADAHR